MNPFQSGLFQSGLCAALLLIPASAVWAGGTATLLSVDGDTLTTVIVEFDGPETLRMTSDTQQDGYLLVREGSAYMVSGLQGEERVIDLAQMMAMMRGMMPTPPALGSDDIGEFVSLEPTGAKETVAGLEGEVFRLTYLDPDGARQNEELVLGQDPTLRELTMAVAALGATMSELASEDAETGLLKLTEELNARGAGVLRFGTTMTVTRLEKATPAASRFELPAEPMQLPNLGGFQMPDASELEGLRERLGSGG